MDYKIAYYSEVDAGQWDSWVAEIAAASYHHSSFWLDYNSRFQNVLENKSFVLLENDAAPLAACPLFLSETGGCKELSVNGAPLGVPALTAKLKPSPRRKLLDEAFTIINKYARDNNAERVIMVSHPITQAVCEDDITGFRNTFEPLRCKMLYSVENTLVIDLKQAKGSAFSKYE